MTAMDLAQRFETAAASTATPTSISQLRMENENAGGKNYAAILFESFATSMLSIPTILLTASTNRMAMNPFARQQQLISKEESIRACLFGNQDGRVDLWKLREFCLTPGGLLNHELRQLAWPKLSSCRHAIVSNDIHGKAHPSKACMKALREGVAHVTWNVEECRRILLSGREPMIQEAPDLEVHTDNKTPIRMVRFENDNGISSRSPIAKSSTSPERMDISPASTTSSLGNDSRCNSEETETLVKPLEDNWPLGSPDENTLLQKTLQTTKHKPSSPEEQLILYRIVHHLLSTPPPTYESTNNDGWYYGTEDHQNRYYYAPGLPDIAALLWIHFDSFSLSTVVLQQMAKSSLRHALCGAETEQELAKTIAFSLLEQFEPKLYHRVKTSGRCKMAAIQLAQYWLNGSWLSGLDMTVAARLLDAFMISHPIFSAYACMAVMTGYRDDVLEMMTVLDDLSKVNGVDERDDGTSMSMIMDVVASALHDLESAEKIVQQALVYMKAMPPQELVGRIMELNESESSTFSVVGALAVELPEWSTAPCDFILDMDGASDGNITNIASFVADGLENKHPLANAALGLPDRIASTRKILIALALVAAVTILCLFMVYCAAVNYPFNSDGATSMPPREGVDLEFLSVVPHKVVSAAASQSNLTIDDAPFPTMGERDYLIIGWCLAQEPTTFRDIDWKPHAFVYDRKFMTKGNHSEMTESLSTSDHHILPPKTRGKRGEIINVVLKLKSVLVSKIKEHQTDFSTVYANGKAVVAVVFNNLKKDAFEKFQSQQCRLAKVQVISKKIYKKWTQDARDLLVWAMPADAEEWMDFL
ncbi:hypothetical protein MPSEU_000449400 [Mayamaea pseudoterrestris]|nr:hypothetical protein MPSEU_000449400 [Mayamaea pseudoterrestris]